MTAANVSSSDNLIPTYGAHVPEDKDQRIVGTPYGEAIVLRTFRNPHGDVLMQEMALTSWKTSSPTSSASSASSHGRSIRPATLYSPLVYPSIPVTVGCDVLCLFGRGQVVDLRTTPPVATATATATATSASVAVVRLSSWRLARRSRVTCYLDVSTIQVVRPQYMYEMSVVEKIEHANELKRQAAHQFANKTYAPALQLYATAVDAVKFVQHTPNSTNAVRADLLMVMITCSNNAATCCLKLEQSEEAHKHAQQALSLIEALEVKKGYKIHDEIRREGYADVKVFGEWKVKSLLIIASVLTEKDDVEVAVNVIKRARGVIATYVTEPNGARETKQPSVKQLQSDEKELVKLLVRCKERRKIQLKREKQRALAMFASKASMDTTTDISPNSATQQSTTEGAPDSSKNGAAQSPMDTLLTNSKNGENAKSAKKPPRTVTFADELETTRVEKDNDEIDVPWHQDCYFLGGLGFLLGVVGTILLASQRMRRDS